MAKQNAAACPAPDPVQDEARKLDERKAAESGPVRSSWDPKLFHWLSESHALRLKGSLQIGMRKEALSIYSEASKRIASGEHRIMLDIGTTAKALAIRRMEYGGVPAFKSKNGQYYAISSRQLIKTLQEQGWPVPSVLNAEWDDEHKMLVVRKPEAGR